MFSTEKSTQEKKASPTQEPEWEGITYHNMSPITLLTDRLKVEGGYLYRTIYTANGIPAVSMVFVPCLPAM